VGRAETATDPADLDMLETTIRLKPQSQWRKGYTYNDIIKELDKTVNVPGLTNSWIMPIKARTDMLSTGINTPVGLKISGPNTDTLQLLGEQAEAIIREIPGTISAFSERAMSGNYMDVKINRQEAARHGVSVADIQKTLKLALAGMRVTTTVEGLERYSINIRYPRELRDSPEKISRILVDLPNGGSLPLSMLADISLVQGPMFIRSENSRPNSWVFVDIEGDNIGAYVHHAHEILSSHLELPNGYTFIWSGEFEYMERMYERLSYVIPITLFLIFLLLFLNTKSFVKTGIVLLAIPFSLIGAIWILYFLDYNMSLAVWIGMIALAGLDAETGVIMLLYLDKAYEKVKKESSKMTLPLLYKAIDLGAVRRIRPKMMTASVILAGLIPILWSQGSGADVMKRIAAPMVGGVVSSVLMELLVYPAIYFLWKKRKLEVTT
jgi:Cu(I)/Ag(I) efflux system membrane protein CusA/SilA